MANIRIKDLSTTAAVTASDDFIAVDGATNGTRKLDAYSPTFGGNLTVSGGKVLISYPSSSQARVSFGGAHFDANSSYASYIRGYSSSATTAGLDFYTTYGSSVLALSLSEQGNATLAGNLTVSGSIVNQNGVIQSTLAAGALISSLSTNNNAVHGFQISGSGTGSRDWRLEQGRAGANSFSISNATGGLTTPLIVNGATNNILIGCSSASSDSGNGKLQLATHTTSAGGIGFGTETSLFRTAAGEVGLDALSGTATVFGLRIAGTRKSYLYWENGTSTLTLAAEAASSSLKFLSANALALTLDSSQNATFAGTVTATGSVSTSKAVVGGSVVLSARNTDNTNSVSAAVAQLTVGGASAGDPRLLFTIDAVQDWSVGVDNSDGDKFKIGPSSSVGTSTSLTLDPTTGNATFAGAIAIGNTVQTAAAVASTHKVTISIGGTTYYLLATNV